MVDFNVIMFNIIIGTDEGLQFQINVFENKFETKATIELITRTQEAETIFSIWSLTEDPSVT